MATDASHWPMKPDPQAQVAWLSSLPTNVFVRTSDPPHTAHNTDNQWMKRALRLRQNHFIYISMELGQSLNRPSCPFQLSPEVVSRTPSQTSGTCWARIVVDGSRVVVGQAGFVQLPPTPARLTAPTTPGNISPHAVMISLSVISSIIMAFSGNHTRII